MADWRMAGSVTSQVAGPYAPDRAYLGVFVCSTCTPWLSTSLAWAYVHREEDLSTACYAQFQGYPHAATCCTRSDPQAALARLLAALSSRAVTRLTLLRGRHVLPLRQATALDDLQRYVAEMEEERGFSHCDIVQQCRQLGEEVGELFKPVLKHKEMRMEATSVVDTVDEEIADALIFLCAIANRLERIDDALRKREP